MRTQFFTINSFCRFLFVSRRFLHVLGKKRHKGSAGFRTSKLKIMRFYVLYWLSGLVFLMGCASETDRADFDVVVLGSGTGAVAAAVQAARSGAQTALVHPLPWLGGMLTSAGVTATDGNHFLPAGLWGEFRQALYDHYGGPDSVATGWVSLTLFEPHVGARILDSMVLATPNLTVYREMDWSGIQQKRTGWHIRVDTGQGKLNLVGRILVDGTDLGDVAAEVGAAFDLGMEAKSETGESWAPDVANDIIQDLTYVAILKEYPPGEAPKVARPEGYDQGEFACACRQNCPDSTVVDCQQMLTYGKLPNGKYMINWPNFGNDYYLNPVPLSFAERQKKYKEAKMQTLRFVYYIQNELGFSNLGLADDEFPTEDRLAFYPYHREGRRIRGLVRTTLNHLRDPYGQENPLYRTGIAVGDYPVDHHHDKNPDAPELSFPPIPSFNIPVGSLIPVNVPNLLVADKPISVSNLANGSTRLQPVILQVGQAAGLMAAMAVRADKRPDELSVRDIQQAMLDAGGYLMPFFDVKPDDSDFGAIQRIGATGLIQGRGEPYQWANRTWFYPDSIMELSAWINGMSEMKGTYRLTADQGDINRVNIRDFLLLTAEGLGLSAKGIPSEAEWSKAIKNLGGTFELWMEDPNQPILRREYAVLLDIFLDPFKGISIGFNSEELK